MKNGAAWFGLPGPIGKRSTFFISPSMYFLGPNALLWGSEGALLTKLTVVPAFTVSFFGRKASSVVYAPIPAYTVLAGGFVAASFEALAQAAAVSVVAFAFTAAAGCTAPPAAFTTILPSIFGWIEQMILYVPPFGNVKVALTGLPFGPGAITPLETSPVPGTVVPPLGPNAPTL